MSTTLLSALCFIGLLGAAAAAAPAGADNAQNPLRQKAQKLQRDGNYKDAFDLYRTLATNRADDVRLVGGDLENGIQCLRSINRNGETDGFLESVVQVHSNNWRLLRKAAEGCFDGEHQGFIVSGAFTRGPHRGQGRYVNSFERDRVRALQLMDRALALCADDPDRGDAASFCRAFARILMGYRGYDDAWRLQYATDLAALPDYEDGWGYGWQGGGETRGAPVDADGNPVFHKVPASFAAAATDGERWRWLLERAAKLDPSQANSVRFDLANFLHQQFGVQTLAAWGFRAGGDDETQPAGAYALQTLADHETIARLATGIRRFKLPEEFDFIRLYRRIADEPKGGYAEESLNTLAQIFENRRQLDQAAAYWERSIKAFGDSDEKWKKQRLDQILDNWGTFEPLRTQAAGKPATCEFRYRNGTRATFAAYAIKVDALLQDVQAYLRSNPRETAWEKVDVQNIGHRLVAGNEKQYLGDKAAEWTMDLKPREGHLDRRVTVTAPLKQAGAYLVIAHLAGGNTSRVILWLNDTILVRKPLDNAVFFFVADAVTGQPVPGAQLAGFGYRHERIEHPLPLGPKQRVLTRDFTATADADGQAILDAKSYDTQHQWLVTATTPAGRLAYLGFDHWWYQPRHDAEYNQTKVFMISDRPVYRPGQPVKFKFWASRAQYDQDGNSPYAKQTLAVIVQNPKREKIFEKTFTADAYGGVDGELALPADAQLGQYYAYVWQSGRSLGGGHFRVEEYKKPEFEVTVEAPREPVMLGEKIQAKVQARYYFGAPVTHARVKVKVLRSSYSAQWYPTGLWDWLYAPGYWWFGYDYDWYPGWRAWGCPRPSCCTWWWPVRQAPPEVVAEVEAELAADGAYAVPLDTALAKELHGDTDHRYEITAEVTDQSRRTIVGQGVVLVARRPFKVTAWVDRGHYRVGDTVRAFARAQTLDRKPVTGKGVATLYRIAYADSKPVETAVQTWNLDTDAEGAAQLQLQASRGGQYRFAYRVSDTAKHTEEGALLFCVRGEGEDGRAYRFNAIELVPDKREYAPGETVSLAINTELADSTVVFFARPSNGVYLKPQVLRLAGKRLLQDLPVTRKDMPNFFVEALTVAGGAVHTEVRQIAVPPESRVLNVEVKPSAERYKPGAPAKVSLRVTDPAGKPCAGSLVVCVYDKALEYISGGSNVGDIKPFFWKWQRHHQPRTDASSDRWFANLLREKEPGMQAVGVFGHEVADEESTVATGREAAAGGMLRGSFNARRAGFALDGVTVAKSGAPMAMAAATPSAPMAEKAADAFSVDARNRGPGEAKGDGAGGGAAEVVPTVRANFADTAFWAGALTADANGTAEVAFKMPENLSGWSVRAWAMGDGTRVGDGSTQVVTSKDLLLRLQAPRFFVEKDEVVLSANVHNYLKAAKAVRAVLELDGGCLEPLDGLERKITVKAGDEQRVDWRVKVVREGEAIVRMKALSDEESDAMEQRFPVYVHGMLKTESFCGVIRRDGTRAEVAFRVPAERRVEQTRLEVRYSPTLAGALVDALPYLASYPYGCTEQTLNRFLPTVITHKILRDAGVDLKALREKQVNLNAQEIGDAQKRAAGWQRWTNNAVFDAGAVEDMARVGVKRLASMQLGDGGWGWFSGGGEHASAHTTAWVVHGLQTAGACGVKVPEEVLAQGVKWLTRYQADEVRKLERAPKKAEPWKRTADNLDALVYMVLADAGQEHAGMREFLYRDRNELAAYGKAVFAMGLSRAGRKDQLAMLLRNLEQLVVEDKENQTAWLNLGNGGYWWCWYGSEYEAQAYYLKLLAQTDPRGARAAGLVKYLLNNRKHASYWNSTRDTALCIEAMADYLRASGEDKPDMTVEVRLDGELKKSVRITPDTLYAFDGTLLVEGAAVKAGAHKLEVTRQGTGPVYFNAYLSNFTLEDLITRAGLEIKVNRAFYRLKAVDKTVKVAGARGQALDQKVEKYEREALANNATVKSGDLLEVELTIESKNDYEYIVFEDMKAAGCEPVEVRSGYNGNDMGAYVEFRDERVCFFVSNLARGTHSVAYRLRAEIPGTFSALPTRAHAMYAPELKANADELKLRIKD